MTRGSKVFRAEDVAESNATSYPEPFRALNSNRYARRLAEFAGLKSFGVNLVRIVPGGQSSCRHAHARQDELVLVMEGDITLETDVGRETLGPGTWVGFPAGTGDAHRFINQTDEDVVFLVIGDRAPDVVTYPDVDLHGAHGPDGVFRYTRKDGSPY
ncbi:MAG: cupin domain-containing protein [Hyphomicrobiaceae bacterium]|nr:cupin domain-containing protein [Hyphomicrobiaceae bacterium]